MDHEICLLGLTCSKTESFDGTPIKLPVKSVNIECDTNNTLAQISTTLDYENTTLDTLECGFILPLDERSAIYHFEAETDGRVIVAEIQERKQAGETYERGIEAHQTTFLLEQDERAADTFRIRLGNLASKAKLSLRIKYILELEVVPTAKKDGATLGLTLPTVLNPRYDPNPDKATFDKDILLTKNPYHFSLTANIGGTMHIDKVDSGLKGDNYNVEYLNHDNTRAKATLTLNEGNKLGDKDIRLLIHYTDAFQPHVIYEKGVADASGNVSLQDMDIVLLNFMPKLKTDNPDDMLEDVKNEFIFIVDRSGSMEGSRTTKAKETLLLLLKSLPIGCHFQIVGFGSTFSCVFEVPMPYEEENLERALRYQREIDADMGGTEVLDPLKHVFSKSVPKGFARQVFLITDGDVGNTDEVITLVSKNKHNSRVFTVGIGEGASTALVRGVARAGGGRAEFVDEDDTNFSVKILQLLRDASQPRFADIRVAVDVPNNISAIHLPDALDSIFEEQFLNVFVLLKGDLDKLNQQKGKVTLRGNVLEHASSFELEFSRSDKDSIKLADQLIHRWAAKHMIKKMTDEDGDKKEIITISKAFNLISKYTSFVGVDKFSKVAPLPPLPKATPRYSCYGSSVPMSMFCRSAPMTMMDEDYYESMTLECAILSDNLTNESYTEAFTPAAPAPPPVSKSVALADLQQFNGTWSDDDIKLWDILELNRTTLFEGKPETWSEDEFATLAVIAYLHVKCAHDKGLWSMYVQKALKNLYARHPKDEVTRYLDGLKAKIY
jgi:von Willebrand factor A domain-containing protein 5